MLGKAGAKLHFIAGRPQSDGRGDSMSDICGCGNVSLAVAIEMGVSFCSCFPRVQTLILMCKL